MNGMMNNFLVAAPGSERVDGHIRSEQILDLSDEGSAQRKLTLEVNNCTLDKQDTISHQLSDSVGTQLVQMEQRVEAEIADDHMFNTALQIFQSFCYGCEVELLTVSF